ncbi:photosynthetic reaction center subunit H [Altererythrobacter rubellus]|jgi:photosynthetic reaction center H subunit|uniref:Photosynthetic reaction center subunit H n=1 Tax=Altererythrobacter rubellus TaxID=2173831 RepID=A0A9Y2F5K4_9SPHN|nr:photosynthetic reaction center subunit H [Altererythrobacter rubellus]WIW96338.1 photosynthetic reaction center subunit H [Altererythrobacter rubellus]
MTDGNIVGTIDVAELALYLFFLFFLALVFWLRREDRREGYPLEDEMTGLVHGEGGPLHTASTKTFKLPFGKGSVTAPTKGREPVDIAAKRFENHAGSPIIPTGNPLKDGIGPAAYAQRSDFPDQYADGALRIVPMRSDDHFSVASFMFSRNPVGMKVNGADGKEAGTVTDLWVDRAESVVRYLEIQTGGGSVLAPITMAMVHKDSVEIDAINAADFADAPKLATPGQVTRLEEDKICGYFGGGYLYANEARQEPII